MMSLWLYNVFIEALCEMRSWSGALWCDTLPWRGWELLQFLYADDTVLIAESEKQARVGQVGEK